MFFVLRYFLLRLSREHYKSLSVLLLAIVLVVLINALNGIHAELNAEYDDVVENHPIVAELTDLTGASNDGLMIEVSYINLFTDPDVIWSLNKHTEKLSLKRGLLITAPSSGILTGITVPETDTHISYFDGYDDSIWLTDELVCVVSEGMLDMVENGKLRVSVKSMTEEVAVTTREKVYYGQYDFYLFEDVTKMQAVEPAEIDVELTVIGTTDGDGVVYCPFVTATAFGTRSDGQPPHTDRLAVTISDNNRLSEFKRHAAMSFSRVNPVYDSRPYAMTIYDTEYYDTLEPLRQYIFLLDMLIPFVYIIGICIGFMTSNLQTRRRTSELVIMRSIGVSKSSVFFGVLLEQALMSMTGVLFGFALAFVVWGYVFIDRTAVFFVCYLLGTVLAIFKTMRVNVLKAIKEKDRAA